MDLDAAFIQAKQLLTFELEDIYDEYHPDGQTVGELEMSPEAVKYFRYLADALQNILADIRRDEPDEMFEVDAEEARRALQETFNG